MHWYINVSDDGKPQLNDLLEFMKTKTPRFEEFKIGKQRISKFFCWLSQQLSVSVSLDCLKNSFCAI